MQEMIKNINKGRSIFINEKNYIVNSKTWYSITEDNTVSYVKCELSDNKILVIIPEDNLIYIGEIIPNLEYKRISSEKILYKNNAFIKTGEGHQFIVKIEFGNKNDIEGNCIFEDYEFENNIISLGILPDKDNRKADVVAKILNIENIKIENIL